MLSSCSDCEFYNSEACAVNPVYWDMSEMLNRRLTTDEVEQIATKVDGCSDWERSQRFEVLSFQLNLTREQWAIFLQNIPSNIFSELPEDLKSILGIEANDFQMIDIESSNIAAIGWRERICQVDFLSGHRYHYLEVPQSIFEEFLVAPSKGRFLNEVFKKEYAFDYEQVEPWKEVY